MNVTVQKTLLFALFRVSLFLLFPLFLSGQYLKASMSVLKDGQQEYYFESSLRPAGILTQLPPKNGKVWQDRTLTSPTSNNTTYVLIYKPNPGFIGMDTFYYNRKTCPGTLCYEEWQVVVTVKSSEVAAQPDLFFSTTNSPVLNLNVLQNDRSDAGGLHIVKITTVNNCTASFPMGSPTIQFQPSPGFYGIASLNYTVCDKLGTCDQASVNVVVDRDDRTKIDTFSVYTLKNESLQLLIPDVYTLVDKPKNGSFDGTLDVPVYQPNTGFVGKDYLRFTRNGVTKVFAVNVINFVRNKFAFDDKADVTPGTSVEIDVLANDRYTYGAGCVSYTKPKYGKLVADENNKGIYTYQAPKGFIGVDVFTYTSYPPGCGGTGESAMVYVYVNSYEPSQTKFRLNTAKTTPLVITYSAPIQNYNFQVTSQGKLGRAIFLPGLVDTVLYGQPIHGYNLILYIPKPGVTGLDQLEFTYCLSGEDNNCRLKKNVKVEVNILNVGSNTEPSCISDCIWMGDTNLDGTVDMQDLLPLGLNMGLVGNPRNDMDPSQWYGQYGNDWSNPYANKQVDLKHLDTDGDSFITAQDTASISKFYGNTHSLTPVALPYYNFEIQLQADFTDIAPGDTLNFDLVLGTDKTPVVDLYGFTFILPYNPTFFKPETFQIKFFDNSWMAYNSPVISMSRNNLKGLLEAGFTRTNQMAISGKGKVARGKGVVIDALDGVSITDGKKEDRYIELGGGTAIGYDGHGNAFNIRVAPLRVKIKTPPVANPNPVKQIGLSSNDEFRIYPNPANNLMRVDAPVGRLIKRIQVYSVAGKLVYDGTGNDSSNLDLDVHEFANGMYFLRVQTEAGQYNQKFEVLK